MANSNGWGDGSANNDIGWGQGANNAIGWGDIHAKSWAGATDIVGVQATSLLLDDYPNAAVAYSLRQLRTAYTGAAIRVRRSSDNAEQDINFIGGDLDTASLLTFCGAGNGFITTWYDQSGNANNATQPTLLSSQAQIVSSSAIITDPNTGKISVTWTNDNYPLTSTMLLTQNLLMTSVINRNTITNTLVNIGNSGSDNQRISVWLNNASSNVVVSQFNNTLVTHETGNTSTGAFIMSGLRDSSSVVKAWRNTTALTTGTASGGVGTAIFNRFGTASTLGHTGRMVEMIYWNNDKESSRADIVTNQNDYWNVY
jgi:hypothetical protein